MIHNVRCHIGYRAVALIFKTGILLFVIANLINIIRSSFIRLYIETVALLGSNDLTKAGDTPYVGVTIVLPHDDDLRYILREDIINLAPMGYNHEPIFLIDDWDPTIRTGLDLEERRRYRDVYPLGASSIPLMIKVIILVKALSLNRDKVLVLSGCNVVDWGGFEDTLVNVGADEVVCLAEGDEENCNSYNILYPMTVLDKILSFYLSEGSSLFIDNLQGWVNLLYDHGLLIRAEDRVISKSYTNSVEYMKDLMMRDPRYSDLMKNEASLHKDVRQVLMRLGGYVDYLPDPKYILLPSTINCVEGGAIFMVQSVHKYSVRRNLYRRLFKAAGVESYYFILARPKPDESILYQMLMEESVEHQDIVLYDAVESYGMLTYKSYAAMIFAQKYCPSANVMYKMDQDVLVDFSTLPSGPNVPDVNCVVRKYDNWWSTVARDGYPREFWSVHFKNWPYKYFYGYCSGPVYGLQMNAMNKIVRYMQRFSWTGSPYLLSASELSLEDVWITGKYRSLAGITDIRHVGYAKHLVLGTNIKIPENDFIDIMEARIQELDDKGRKCLL